MPEIDPHIEKAFDFAQEATKQLIALATGIIALTITFLTDVVDTASAGITFLRAAWVLYLVSVILGIFTLLSLAGNLERPGEGQTPSIYRGNVVTFSIGQIACFGAALAFTLVFGFKAV
jgi:hypothetical protein